jgi:hypothetical protein
VFFPIWPTGAKFVTFPIGAGATIGIQAILVARTPIKIGARQLLIATAATLSGAISHIEPRTFGCGQGRGAVEAAFPVRLF